MSRLLTGVSVWTLEVWDDPEARHYGGVRRELTGTDTEGKEHPRYVEVTTYDDGVDPYSKGATYETITYELVEVERERHG